MRLLLELLLPSAIARSHWADYLDFKQDQKGADRLLRCASYQLDLLLYCAQSCIARRVHLHTRLAWRSFRQEPLPALGLLLYVPHLYLYLGMIAYFLLDGAWLRPTGHYPMVIGGWGEVAFATLAIAGCICLLLGIIWRRSVPKRPRLVAAGCAAQVLGILIMVAART